MDETLALERKRLSQIMASRMVGICFLDATGRLVQLIDGDIALRDMIIDYQKERIMELETDSSVRQTMPGYYPKLAY